MTDHGFQKIYYRGKEVKCDGFTGKMKAISVVIEHNADGSVTVCKEIADQIFNNKRVPAAIRKYFDTTPLLQKIGDEMSKAEYLKFGNMKVPKSEQ